MYALASYQHYTYKVDMDHVMRIRTMHRDLGYDECMDKMDTFHHGLLLCMSDKSFILDIFGELAIYVYLCVGFTCRVGFIAKGVSPVAWGFSLLAHFST